MTERPIDKLLTLLSEASNDQIDTVITQRLASLVGKPYEEMEVGLKDCLDDSAHGALASDFAMMAMHETWKMVLKELGKEPYYGRADDVTTS